jgi:NADPH-dependent 2,4-dienoyl-CoA reductase/sulfur reductase-like enzyme/rhodanese-related sulfurtransferase
MKLVIIGGVAGGASAATRARRLQEHAEIIILQRGPDVSFANCGMPYYIGGEIHDRNKLAVQTPASLRQRFRLDVRVNTTVLQINPDTKTLQVKNDTTNDIYAEKYDELILAVGAEAVRPSITGIETCSGLFTLRSLEDMDRIHDHISRFHVTSAAVIGAGYVGLEMAEQLTRRGLTVTLIERDAQVMAPLDPEMASYLHDSLQQHGVDVILNDSVVSFVDQSNHEIHEAAIHLKSGRTVVARLVILGVGVTPDTRIAVDAGIQCTDCGYIVVDDFLHTSKPNIWAVGDAIRVRNPILPECNAHWSVPLAGPANRQGRMVADNILLGTTNRRTYKGTYGVAVLRLWDQIAACVGLNEKVLRTKQCVHDLTVIHIHPSNHAGYFPGASQLHIKVLFNKETGKIYGAQAVGGEGVDKRIDVIATAMQGGMTMDSLADLELCYAPPVGSAKDPVNYAGMVAQNIMDGLVSQVEWYELEGHLRNTANCSDKFKTAKFLDVRNPDEIAKGGSVVSNAVNIPLDSLRDRIQELDPSVHWIVSCASGQRAYYACRILLQHGFTAVSNLGGAYQTFHSIHPGPCCDQENDSPLTASTNAL